MANYDEMWEILEQYQFAVESNMSVHCILCNNLLIDACQGPCGCLYCRCCIEKYLDNTDKYCPGNSESCSTMRLDMRTNIVKDQHANYKISQLQTKCPSESCHFLSVLIEVCHHLKICEKAPTLCPYRPMGCFVKPMLIDRLAEHLQVEIYSHNKLLVEWIMRIQNNNSSSIDEHSTVSMETQLERLFEKLSLVLTKKQVILILYIKFIGLFRCFFGTCSLRWKNCRNRFPTLPP